MEKLYVNEIGPTGEISTVGLFYSHAEAQRIVDMLRLTPNRANCRYEIIDTAKYFVTKQQARRSPVVDKE